MTSFSTRFNQTCIYKTKHDNSNKHFTDPRVMEVADNHGTLYARLNR